MATSQRAGLVLGQIQRLFGHGTVTGLSEGQLLARFVGDRDEVAFEAIVSRHGPMVLGICRRLLDDPHDVEDAFQATFLVLVKKARAIRDRDLLANWLYGVALQVARRSRRDRTRRRSRERCDLQDDVLATSSEADLGELRVELDAEVARLPVRFRTPIVLCYFEGLTHDQAAERLGCPVGTVRSRMAKGRELLRSRLTRRGLAPTSAVLVVPAISEMAPSIPPALLTRTITAAMRLATGQSLTAAVASTSVMTLIQGVLRTMSLTRWMTFAAVLVCLGGVGGVGVAARQLGAGPADQKSKAEALPSQSSENTVRKAVKDIQDVIREYKEKLKTATAKMEVQSIEILELKGRIRKLEAQLRAESPKGAASGGGFALGAPGHEASGVANGAPGHEASPPDYITTTPRLIVSQSAANDRVVIYATETGKARSYRPPHGMNVYSASAWQDTVLITAMGPKTTQLAMYRLDPDRWDIRDLCMGTKDAFILPFVNNSQSVVASSFGRSGHPDQDFNVTQLAVYDSEHARWSVLDLDEPFREQGVSPIVQGHVGGLRARPARLCLQRRAGRWDTLILDKPLANAPGMIWSPLVTMVHGDSAAVSQGGHLHVFTAKTGRWQTIDTKD